MEDPVSPVIMSLSTSLGSCILFVFLPLLSILATVSAQTDNQSLSDLFPQLKDLERFKAPGTGYGSQQNTTYCCLQAVNHALAYTDGTLQWTNQSDVTISGTLQEFNQSAVDGQFPCTATYVQGDYIGAPDVLVSWAYCEDTCGRGWQRTTSTTSGGWLQAFVGFIIPAIVFCLSIPRRRKIEIPDELFDEDIFSPGGFIKGLCGFMLAAVLAALDILIWLSLCFACSGSMMLSAAHEAILDLRVVRFLDTTLKRQQITTDMRARLLFLVLIGNLDINAKPPPKAGDPPLENNQSSYLTGEAALYHVEKIIYDLRIHNSSDGSYHPSQWPIENLNNEIPDPPFVVESEVYKECVEQTRTRLRTMLECQYSFGSTVGAPVVFFVAAFVYTLFDTLTLLGNETYSLSLAFGTWWMIVPHIAILSGLLLAGNNPNTLEGVLALRTGTLKESRDSIAPFEKFPFTDRTIPGLNRFKFQLAYPSRYKIAWLWRRGYRKQQYIDMIIKVYGQTAGDIPLWKQRSMPEGETNPSRGPLYWEKVDPLVDDFAEKTHLNFSSWITIFSIVVILIGVPFGLAFATAFTTPTIGLACRSFTFLIYTITQFLQIILLMLANKYGYSETTFPETSRDKIARISWYTCTCIVGAAAIFTSIGGTMMELIGAYSECKCNTSLWYWLDLNNPNVWIEISTNSAQDIREAKKFWASCAITAIVFLSMLSYIGWWYQRKVRNTFHKIVESLSNETRKVETTQPTNGHGVQAASTNRAGTPTSSVNSDLLPVPVMGLNGASTSSFNSSQPLNP